jgi:aminopeptidase N
MDEGLAQFMALLWTEQRQGRSAMVAELADLLQPLTLAEPAFTAASTAAAEPGNSIITSPDELYYRRKAAAVWLMLRGIVGDGTLAAALTAWRAQPASTASGADQAVAFERLLEKLSGKDLAWFFRDWVLRDRGLAELSIVDVAPRTLPAGKGHDSGWLVAVTVRNDGAAEVEVPIVIRSGTFSTTKRLRVPAFGNVTDRVVVEAAPTEVIVNDGTTPETTSSLHRREVVLNPEP